MTFDDQVRKYKELSRTIDDLEQEKKALGGYIMQQMKDKSMRVGDFIVKRFMRLSIHLSVEDARILNAVKQEEVVDKEKVKALYHSGQQVQGVSEVHYIQISSVNKT